MSDNQIISSEDLDHLKPDEAIKEFVEKLGIPQGYIPGSAGSTPDEEIKRQEAQVKKTISELLTNVVNPQSGTIDKTKDRHISEFDKEELKAEADKVVDRIASVKEHLQTTKEKLDSRLTKSAANIEVDLGPTVAKDILLKQAMRRLFGATGNILTYDLYKKALELRERFNKEDMDTALEDMPIRRDNLAELK